MVTSLGIQYVARMGPAELKISFPKWMIKSFADAF